MALLGLEQQCTEISARLLTARKYLLLLSEIAKSRDMLSMVLDEPHLIWVAFQWLGKPFRFKWNWTP